MTDQIAVGSSGKHGQAAYATQDLQPGEYILREFPAFTISPPAREQETGLLEAIMNARNISAADIAAAVKTITSKQTEEFRKVACVFDTDLSRFMCVHYDIRPMHNEPPAAFGYFSKGSYFNHSCRPNAHYFWDERSKSMTWLALTNIMSGEEITISYLPIIHWETVSERRSLLKRLFLFECDCEFCEVESSNDTVHAQRIKVNNLHNAITDLLSDLSPTTKAFCSRGKHLADDYITLVTNDLQSGQSIDPKLYKACVSSPGNFHKH